MASLFVVGGWFINPHKRAADQQYRAIATFRTRTDAQAFVDAESCGELEISEHPLFDDYGYPIKPHEFPAIRPRVFAELCVHF